MGLAASSSARQHDIALLSDEAAGGEIADQGLVDRSAFELTLHERATDHALSTRANKTNKTLARDNHRGDHHPRRDTDSPF